MPKANRSSTAPPAALQGEAPISPRDAAGLIIDLINSRPHSPRPEEIEDIIARASAAPSVYVPPSGLAVLGVLTEEDYKPERIVSPELEAWSRVVASHLDALGACKEDADIDALDDRVSQATDTIWARPVRTWSDLVLRAAVAVYWNSTDYPDEELEGEQEGLYDVRALAHLVRGIINIAGLSFDPDGRLLGSDGPGCADPNMGGASHG